MDRNTLLAVVLISLILVVWTVWFSPAPPPPPTPLPTDSTEVAQQQEVETPTPEVAPVPAPAFSDSTFLAAQQGDAREITVETDLYTAKLSTRGGTLTSFILKAYKESDQETPVQLIDTTGIGALALAFFTPDSRSVDSRTLLFSASESSDYLDAQSSPRQLTFTSVLNGGTLQQTYTFTPDSYEVDYDVTQTNADAFSTVDGYEVVWHGGVPFAEREANQEALMSGAYVRSGGEVESVLLNSEPTERLLLGGTIEWAAVKNAFFTALVRPEEGTTTKGVEIEGRQIGETDNPDYHEDYTARISLPRPSPEPDQFHLYLGPVDNETLAGVNVDLYDVVDYGFGQTITRPIAKYVILPVFQTLRRFIGNYGVIIILFAILVKLILSPLTKSSFRSMAKMRMLQPKMQEIKEKYADDVQKQQEATMKLYRESGVNPLGSCLPQMLQLPILFALFRFFPSAIDIRQQGFLWATDLSGPDVILNLPFTIPFYGNYVAGFTLLMTAAMFVQMQIQQGGSTGGGAQANQMKMMMYFMPFMILFIFNSFASGLSLYYLTYNVFTAVQQKLINRSLEAEGLSTKAAPANKKGAASKAKRNGRAKPAKAKAKR